MTEQQLLHLQDDQVRTAAQVLTRAFHLEPKFVYFMPNPAERAGLSPYMFEFTLRLGLLYGQVHIPSPAIEGAAVWLSPENVRITREMALAAGGQKMVEKLGPEIMARQQPVNQFTTGVHERLAPFPHWYLWVLGVDPKNHGRGLASTLLKPILVRADQERLPCFLETHTEINVAMYRHFGFQVVEEMIIPDTDIRHWIMIRPGN